MMFAFLSRLANLRRERTRRPAACRPTLEPLEERCVPTGWGFSLGTPNVSDWGTAVTVDSLGRSYVSGYLSAPADVDPGPNTVNASGTFVARYNPDGSLDNTFGSSGVVSLGNLSNGAFARGVVVGSDGSVVVVGRFNPSVDFDPQHSYADNRDVRNNGGDFVWKMDASGNFQWVHSYAGGDSIRVAIDGSNNLYVAGSAGPTDFDPDNVWADGRDTPAGHGGADLYVAKFDPSGVLQWARLAGGAGDDAGHSIAVRSDGTVYVTGTVASTPATFGSLTLASGSNVGVVARLDTNGNFDRLYQAGGTDVALDASGNVFAASSSGQSITKLNSDLSAALWTKVISSPNLNLSNGTMPVGGPYQLATGPDGSIYAVGTMPAAENNNFDRGGDPAYLDLDPDPVGRFEVSTMTSLGGPWSSVYTLRLGGDGSFLSTHFVKNTGVNLNLALPRVAIDPMNGDLLTVGYGSAVVLDTGGPTDVVTAAVPNSDGFVLRTTQDLGAIAGRLFNDLNGDGVRETGAWNTGEWDLTGYSDPPTSPTTDTRWKVALLDSGNNVLQTVAVGAAGEYFFNHVPAGTYTVRVEGLQSQRTGWTSTTAPSGSFTVTLGAGQYLGGQDIGLSPGPATASQQADPQKGDWAPRDGGAKDLVTGLVWSNMNRNDTWDNSSNDANGSTLNGYSDWRLPTMAETIATAHSGLAVQSLEGDTWTSDTSNKTAWVVNRTSGTATLYGKKNLLVPFSAMVRDTGTRIDDGTTGYTDTGWSKKSSSSAQDGDYRTAAKGTGSQTATWTFSGLQPGAAYRISASWLGASGNASNAPYKIYDGNTLLGTVYANQTTSSNEYVIGNLGWQGLGTFRTTTGTLKIVLNNNANGTVVADSVRLFLVYPPSAGAPLVAAAGPAANAAPATLTTSNLQPLVQEAAARWQAAGLTSQQAALLRGVDVQIANLGGATLGMASGNTIFLDDNAAGWGWFVDPTPRDDSEFTTPGDQGEQGKIDLLTVLTHEMGHLLGLEHSGASGDVMNATLGSGVRLMPTAGDLPGSTLAGLSSSRDDDTGKAHPHLRALPASSSALDTTDAVFAELARKEAEEGRR